MTQQPTTYTQLLVSALRLGKVEFTYTKADGSARKAIGTLNPEVAAESGEHTLEYLKTALDHDDSKSRVIYYDLEADGLRNFDVNKVTIGKVTFEA